MATATKQRSLHQQLHDLQQRAEQAQAKARAKRDERTRWENEIHELRARIDTVPAGTPEHDQLKREIVARDQSRIHGTGTLADEYTAALEPYHALDRDLQAFKRDHLRELITETIADVEHAIDHARDGWEQIAAAANAYLAARDRAHTLVTSVAGMDGQDLGWDPRIEQWQRNATDALDIVDTVIAPQLTDLGNWKVDHQHD
jgi:chromosome segregation ATPase